MNEHEDTQADLHRIPIEETENPNRLTPLKNMTGDVLPPIKSRIRSTQKGQNKQENKKTDQVTPVLSDATNIVKIKPKNRTSSVLNADRNNENSVQPLEIQIEQKRKRTVNQSKFSTKNEAASQLKISQIVTRPRDFLLRPVPLNEVTKCTVDREIGLLNNHLSIKLNGKAEKLIALDKKFTLIGNKIILRVPENSEQRSVSQNEQFSEKLTNPLLGYLESNFDGSIFNLFEIDQINARTEIIATFQYFGDVGAMGAPRKVKIYIKDPTVQNIITNLLPDENLKQLIDRQGTSPAIHCFSNMSSRFDSELGTFGLNFNATNQVLPSVHNMIMVNEDSTPIIKLYKTDVSSYEIQMRHPITPLIGCAFAISSFLFKLVSQ